MKTSDQIRQIADEIEAELKADKMPGNNKPLVDRLGFLASQLAALDTYVSEKAGGIIEKTKIFRSARRHEKCQGGPALLRAEMNDLIGRPRTIADRRERNGG